MITGLLKNRPSDMTEEEFKKMWENSGHTLEALYKTLDDFMPKDKISAKDFDCPNHYAKLVADQVQRDTIEKIKALFPKSLTL